MTASSASSTFDVYFVGAGHNGLIGARYLAKDSGWVCLLDRRRTPAKPGIAPSESFLDDPEDFKKRSRTGSPYENPNPHNTYWLCGRLLRGAGCCRIDSGTGPPLWIAGERGVSAGRRRCPRLMPHANAALPQPIQPTNTAHQRIETRSGYEH
ncbi:MAG: hypothetical protein QOE94_4274 [Mycobacterium sp.]|jgi:choline dehydrogenase-like flavoprotein|nr:hypothetical protein [Mycobacterium sp.]